MEGSYAGVPAGGKVVFSAITVSVLDRTNQEYAI
jgi:hypothetical protein